MDAKTVIGWLIAALCVLLLIVFLPKDQMFGYRPDPDKPNDRIRLENELRTTLVQILGGLFVLLGLIFAYQNLMTLRDGQITDRFTKAVDQLGSKDFSIRLGGILSLERIARESERDHRGVMEML